MRLKSAGVLMVAVMVVVGGLALWIAVAPVPPAPTADEWRLARDHIKKDFRDGDGIRVHPFWLRDAAAVLGTVQGDRRRPGFVDVSFPPDPLFAAQHDRLWVVSALGRDDAPVPAGAELRAEDEVAPGLVVGLYDMPPSPVTFALVDHLSEASVERFGPRKIRRTCKWKGGKHRCRGRHWEDVEVVTREAGGSPRRCFVLHPYPDGGTVSIRWKDVKLGAAIVVRSGLTLDAARNERGSPMRLELLVDGHTVASRQHGHHDWDFAETRADTSDRDGQRAEITIEVTARQEDYRDLCVDGYVLSEVPADLEQR